MINKSTSQVTYRVVQVSGQGREDGGRAVVSAAAFSGPPQAVIQNPFSDGVSPGGETVGGETRFTYFPATAVSDGAVSVQAAGDPTLAQAGGQFYVMVPPPDVLQLGAQRSLVPRTQPYPVKMDGTRTPRDERRRAQHNEVERRRRDKINNWIVTLSKIIPDCTMDTTKTGASKGGILSKACDYIQELRQSNQRLQEALKEVQRIQGETELCRRQIEELKNENVLLRTQLQQRGVDAARETAPQ